MATVHQNALHESQLSLPTNIMAKVKDGWYAKLSVVEGQCVKSPIPKSMIAITALKTQSRKANLRREFPKRHIKTRWPVKNISLAKPPEWVREKPFNGSIINIIFFSTNFVKALNSWSVFFVKDGGIITEFSFSQKCGDVECKTHRILLFTVYFFNQAFVKEIFSGTGNSVMFAILVYYV